MNCYNCNTEIPECVHFCDYNCKDEYIAKLPTLSETQVTHCWHCGSGWNFKSHRRFHGSKCLDKFVDRVKFELRVVNPCTCKHCNGEVNYPVSGNFCSESCRKTYAERYRPKPVKKEPIIPNRTTPIPIKQKKEEPKPEPKPIVYKTRVCPVCNKEYEYKSSDIEHSFWCSNLCRRKSRQGDMPGIAAVNIGSGSSRRLPSYDVDDY